MPSLAEACSTTDCCSITAREPVTISEARGAAAGHYSVAVGKPRDEGAQLARRQGHSQELDTVRAAA
jgi:hypothetical protein